jgi:hypothetical protein
VEFILSEIEGLRTGFAEGLCNPSVNSGQMSSSVRLKNIMTKLKSPNDLFLYITETIRLLNDVNITKAATLLENINNTYFTTGSEWLGELGFTVRLIELKFSVPISIQKRLNFIMVKVNEVWPNL